MDRSTSRRCQMLRTSCHKSIASSWNPLGDSGNLCFSPPSESEAEVCEQHVRARYWLTKLAGAAQLQRLSLPETETLINDLAVTRGMGQFNWSRAMSCQLARARTASEARYNSFDTPLYRFLCRRSRPFHGISL